MSTSKGQRIGIWIITIVMAVGAVGVYFVAILANNNDAARKTRLQELYSEYQQKVNAQATILSAKYYPVFSPFASRVGVFDKEQAQKALTTEDLSVGDGDVIASDTKFAVYYIGWTPDGVIFDQSIKNGALQAPLSVSNGLAQASLIDGWKEGLIGMKIGGVRELTIPSEKAYKSAGSGSSIPADTPLRFVVMAIAMPDDIPLPAELVSSD